MAKRHHQRDANDVARHSLPVDSGRRLDGLPDTLPDLPIDPLQDPVHDRRFFHPERERLRLNEQPLRNPISSLRNNLRVYREKRLRTDNKQIPRSNRFRGYDFARPADWLTNPRETLVCFKRRVRREVMNALFKKHGAGKGAKRPEQRRRYNADSDIHCRR